MPARPGLSGPGEDPVPDPVSAAPTPPAEAEQIFGEQLGLARRYADLLATTGISHGLIGPREAGRLWERHLVNCAVVQELLPQGTALVDIGSGAGLPGVVLAIARPDLEVHLVEPLLRRTSWLEATIDELGLTSVQVHRGRAEEVSIGAQLPVATARAVASIEKLVTWSFPLLAPGGRLLALKGAAAEQELADARPLLQELGVPESRVHLVGEGEVSEPVRVVEIVRPDVLPERRGSAGRDSRNRTPRTSSRTDQGPRSRRRGRR